MHGHSEGGEVGSEGVKGGGDKRGEKWGRGGGEQRQLSEMHRALVRWATHSGKVIVRFIVASNAVVHHLRMGRERRREGMGGGEG